MKTTSDASRLVTAVAITIGSFIVALPAMASEDLATMGTAVHVAYFGAPAENPAAEATLPSLRAWSGTLSVPLHGR
ncbi:hypothetical protein LLE87_31370, partial [Paenibacillus polymyxa]|nr:hypothetical protein [Paenibacillus polymyxa]